MPLAIKTIPAPAVRKMVKRGDCSDNEPQRDGPVLRGKNREGSEPEHQKQGRTECGRRYAAPRPVDGVAEQRAGRDPTDTG